jgi:hypothetical protein
MERSKVNLDRRRRKRQIEQVVASSLETDEAEVLVEETTREVTKAESKTTRTKKAATERGVKPITDQAMPTAHLP